jgi:catechol-2,3-dioxygenase
MTVPIELGYGQTISPTDDQDSTNSGDDVGITGMNHAVLYVRDARRQQHFYHEVLGFSTVIEEPNGGFVFMRGPDSSNHHDIAFFTIGGQAADSDAGRRTVGMYHIAWEVRSLAELEQIRSRLSAANCLVGASDHGANKSLYAKDPDGLEFEVMWLVPREDWGDEEHEAIIRPLDLEAELQRNAPSVHAQTAQVQTAQSQIARSQTVQVQTVQVQTVQVQTVQVQTVQGTKT